jgi:16S rRNA (guanine(527)-N(7))-methyltransferase RsmG
MFRELLASEFRPYAELSAVQLEQLEQHYNLLLRWNQSLNLTRIADISDSVRFHYCESLYLGLKLPPGPLNIADVGSGAGFPGIPIAVVRPGSQLTLIESHKRKSVFLREAARNLSNVRVLSVRADEVAEPFDWVVSRAVAPADVLAAKLSPCYALLVAAKDAPSGSDIVKCPWGEDRNISVPRGTCEMNVPR